MKTTLVGYGILGQELHQRLQHFGFDVTIASRTPPAKGRHRLLNLKNFKEILIDTEVVIYLIPVVDSTTIQSLIQACESNGIRHLLFLSQGNRAAEELIEQSSLNYTILRPGLILDHRTPGFQALLTKLHQPWLLLPASAHEPVNTNLMPEVAEQVLKALYNRLYFRSTLEIPGRPLSLFQLLTALKNQFHLSTKLWMSPGGFTKLPAPRFWRIYPAIASEKDPQPLWEEVAKAQLPGHHSWSFLPTRLTKHLTFFLD